eukprot:TRINITY_DN70928_c0_g1_i1.p1 TRINITY_DN70928_c0_g1~~TRINITY_DN70928_c0_g1_i1.p1  ORF type:complete len:500 (+),score=97.40 TRINITY_DN70928_c0_g1_i1:146-1645(+)
MRRQRHQQPLLAPHSTSSGNVARTLILLSAVAFFVSLVAVYVFHVAQSDTTILPGAHNAELLLVERALTTPAEKDFVHTNKVRSRLYNFVNAIVEAKPPNIGEILTFPSKERSASGNAGAASTDAVSKAATDAVAAGGAESPVKRMPAIAAADVPAAQQPWRSYVATDPSHIEAEWDPFKIADVTERNRYVALLASLIYDHVRPGAAPADGGLMERLAMVRKIQSPLRYKPEANRVAVIVEPRCSTHLERVIRIVMALLGPRHWNLHVWHSKESESCVLAQLQGMEYKRSVASEGNFDVMRYNALLRSEPFWQTIDGPPDTKVLIFQTDSMVCRGGIEQFTPFDYIGAPWPEGWKESAPGELGGNGGTSLRGKEAMLDCVRNVSLDDVYRFRDESGIGPRGPFGGLAAVEDLFFSNAIILRGRRMAPRPVALQFSSETINTPNSFAIHKYYGRSAPECQQTMLEAYQVPVSAMVDVVKESVSKAGSSDSAGSSTVVHTA